MQMQYLNRNKKEWTFPKSKPSNFLTFVLSLVKILVVVKCYEKNKATHVRTQDRVEPVKMKVDDTIMTSNNPVNRTVYEGLSNFPVWEDTSDTDISLSKETNKGMDEDQDEYSIKRGFKELAKNVTTVYGNLVQSNLELNDSEDDESAPNELSNHFPIEYAKEAVKNDPKILNGLNKEFISRGKFFSNISDFPFIFMALIIENKFPIFVLKIQDFSTEKSKYKSNNRLDSTDIEGLLKETRRNHRDEHEKIEEYLEGLNITSPLVKSKISDAYDSYILLAASAQEYNDIYNNKSSSNETKTPLSIPLKPYYIWEGIDKLWELKMSKTTTPSPKTREIIDKIDNYNSFMRWKREEPFRVYDAWYDAIKERKDGRDSLRREAIRQRDRVLEEKMNKQRAFYSPTKEKFDDLGNATETMARHIDNRFGQLFGEVTDVMDKESKER
ncbi:hypothetical protein HWI79_2160 [Cryptosporidium felis]|nr:hypothetical protein HWI79_2160 [Cryptosporidium felis]